MTLTTPIVVDEALRQHVSTGGAPWVSRNLYWSDTGAGNWLAVVGEPTYPLRDPSKFGIRNNRLAALAKLSPNTFVSLGPGDGIPDVEILRALRGCSTPTNVSEVRYIPVDISRRLLEVAVANVRPHASIPIAVHCDFEAGSVFLPNTLSVHATRPILFGLLGGTLGNLDRGERLFLDTMRDLMRPGDALLIDVPVAGPRWSAADEPRLKLDAYTQAFRDFLAEGATLANGAVGLESDRVLATDSDMSVLGTFTDWANLAHTHDDTTGAEVITVANRLSGRKVLEFRRYRWDSILSWFKQSGLRVEFAKSSIESGKEQFGMGVVLLMLPEPAEDSMTAWPMELVAQGFRGTRVPMILLDAAGVVAQINIPCRALLELDGGGCMGRHFSYLVNRLKGKLQGELLPPEGMARSYFSDVSGQARPNLALATEDLQARTSECRYYSVGFGPVSLRTCELPCVDTASGTCSGSILSFEITDLGDMGAFRKALDRRLAHELLWQVYAASYDRLLPEMPFYQEVVERHCAALQPDSIQAILDVGAGTGTVTVRLLQLGKRVTAVDVCRAMLEKLEAKVGAAHDKCLTILEDTAESMPYLDNESFDAANVLLAFFDMQDPFAALSEVERVLRPGGALIVTEPRACFNVSELMVCAEESLRAKGLFERLSADWARVHSVAPLIHQRIKETQSQTSPASAGAAWNAEFVFEHLRRKGYADLTFRESHMGNCATITGIKPNDHD